MTEPRSRVNRMGIVEDAVRVAERNARDKESVFFVHFDAHTVWVREIGASPRGKHTAVVVGSDGVAGWASTRGNCMDCHASLTDAKAAATDCGRIR